MAYNAGKNVTPLHVRRKFYHQRFWGKKFLHKPNHPYPQHPPLSLPQNSNGIASFDFVFMLGRRKTKENKATNRNLRYVIYNIYIKFYILPQEIELGK